MSDDQDAKMTQLQYVRETERLKHEWEKERLMLKYELLKRTDGRQFKF